MSLSYVCKMLLGGNLSIHLAQSNTVKQSSIFLPFCYIQITKRQKHTIFYNQTESGSRALDQHMPPPDPSSHMPIGKQTLVDATNELREMNKLCERFFFCAVVVTIRVYDKCATVLKSSFYTFDSKQELQQIIARVFSLKK